MPARSKVKTQKQLLRENADLRARLEEADETLRAIRSGQVDALVVVTELGEQVFTLKGAEQPYRILIEEMNEGALTLTAAGDIMYCNRRFAEMLKTPIERVIGSSIYPWVERAYQKSLALLLKTKRDLRQREELELVAGDGTRVPAHLSINRVAAGQELGLYGLVATDLTEQKRNEQIVAQEKLARSILDQALEAIVVCDETGRIIRSNAIADALCGDNPVGQPFAAAFALRLGEGQGFSLDAALQGQSLQGVEAQLEHRAQVQHVLVSAGPLFAGGNKTLGCVVTLTNITERKQKEAELHRLYRTLRALSNTNQAMMRAQGEAEFLRRVCQIVVEDCGHAMVWIGYAEEDEAKTVRPVASAGFDQGYLDTMNITWADTPRGRGPTGTAIRTGKTCTCRNMLTDPKFEPWRDEALKRGYASSMALPLMARDNAFGAITIYSRKPDPFSEEEIRLLAELADDLALGITADRLRVAHAHAEEALRRNEERYRSLFNAMTEGFALHEIICDEEGKPCNYRFLDINPAFERLTGLKREQVIGRTMNDVLPDDDPLWIEAYGRVALSGEPIHFEHYSPALGHHYEVFAYQPAPRQFAVVFSDVSDRKGIEEALRASKDGLERTVAERTAELQFANERLRLLTQNIVSTQEEERRRVSRELHDEAGQALTALKLSLQVLQAEFPSGWVTYRQQLGDAVVLTDRTLERIRLLAQDLRPAALESAGLNVALESLCREYAQRTQIQIRYAGAELPNLGPAAISLYRLLQEALTNAVRHGHATEIEVRLEHDAEQVSLSVEDNGLGFDSARVLSDPGKLKGLGLIGMQERIQMVGGRLEIWSNPGRGARLIAQVPLEEP